jgi:two-component system, NtrC family, response regulator AtoC
MARSILVVDDDRAMRSFLTMVLRDGGYRVQEAASATQALEQLGRTDFDLVLTDLRMPGMSGVDLIKAGRESRPDLQWVIITAFGSIGNAVEAMKAGASDYLPKPLKNPEELMHVVGRIFKEAEATETISLLSEELGKQFPPNEMVFLGEKMGAVHEMVKTVAATNATVLIHGQSGTGKELVARIIHQLSPRKSRPFLAVHCGALADTLLESELFGHERGAFTGAIATRKGRFELADGGTMFLDEIGDISASMQVKLLRVLQERTFERVGAAKQVSVDIRIISATNKDLKAEVSERRFREDLFYRLNVFPITLPPLVERREAIRTLADYFLKRFSASLNKKVTGLSEEAARLLEDYTWPGNIRELQNVMERAVILAKGTVEAEQLNIAPTPAPVPDQGLLRKLEKDAMEKVLVEVGGNRRRAAEVLGVSLRTLQYRIKEYGL